MARLFYDKGRKNYELFLDYIRYRIKMNKNVVIAATGPTGSGKSYSCLRMSKDLQSNFDVDRIAFDPEQFMGIHNRELKKGECVLYDDAGVSFGSRNWYSISNKMLHYFLQICRSENQVLFFNTPDFSFLDSGARKMFHIHLETCGIDFENKVCLLKPLMLQNNQRTGKVYAKYLRFRVSKGYGGVRRLDMIQVPLVDSELIDAYERKKSEFLTKLKTDIYQQILKGKPKRPELTDAQQEWIDLYKQGLNPEQIAEKLGISSRASYERQRLIRLKVSELPEVTDQGKYAEMQKNAQKLT